MNSKIFFNGIIREIYMAFYEVNWKYFRKKYCYHVSVIDYALYTGKGRAAVKKISEISKIVGVSKRTLQFYDDEGMIKVERSENNYRLYDERTLEKLWEIMIYKEMRLKLGEIKQLLGMSENEKKGFFQAYIERAEEKIKELERQKRFISLIIAKGLPQIPDGNSDKTYKNKLAELRESCIYE